MDMFLLYAIIAGILMSISAGPLGCFVIWKKVSYFGDALSHAALLGVAIGLLTNLNNNIAILIVILLFVVVMLKLRSNHHYDSLLAILSNFSVAIALILTSLGARRINLSSILFGDILLITNEEIAILFGFAICCHYWLFKNWVDFLLATINKEIAISRSIDIEKLEFKFLLLLGLFIGISIKLVGVLLISSLLVIPSSSARLIAKSPKEMIFYSVIIGIISTSSGLLLSYYIDLQSGPAIICVATIIFAALNIKAKLLSE